MVLLNKSLTIIAALSISATSLAATITINSGYSMIVSGGEVLLDCSDVDVIVNSGGTLSISGGTVKDLNVTVQSGGSYNRSGGTVTECDGFYIITTPNGAVIINL